jgi:heparan-alpha-glucosaminide N-acetyltransferase
MQLMILVDDAGGEWPVIGHAPWNGCNLADFVMPFFLFIVGMAIPLSLKVRPSVRPCCSSHVHALSASIGVPFYTLLHATMSSVKY